jgi:ribulose kinase
MPNGSFVIAVDVGSTSARAGIFDAAGNRLARAEHPFAVGKPLSDHAEHRSEEIWLAVCTATRAALKQSEVRAEAVMGLAFDATCSLAMFDAAEKPVTVSSTGDDAWNVVMWADHRAVGEAEQISATKHRTLDYVPLAETQPSRRLDALRACARPRGLLDLARDRPDRSLGLHGDVQMDLSEP